MENYFDVTNYGILGDGKTNNTGRLNVLLKKAGEKGGIVFVPPGQYVTGSIRLYSNTTLYLASGAVLLGSDWKEDFPVLDRDDLGTIHRCGLIHAENAENITVCGGGKIDGRGWFWWDDPKQPRPNCIAPVLCNQVKIENITIVNSPNWTIHPLCCTDVVIHGISIKNPYDSPNTDGINPNGCSNVRISDCCIDVGDDCLTLKSGTEYTPLAKSRACEAITITNCTMLHGHGGVVIGSEMSGGVRNVTISNCVFKNTDRGIRIKTRRKRAGIVEDILVNNVIMDNVLVPFCVNAYYCCGKTEDKEYLFSREKQPVDADTPQIRNIRISNVTARNVKLSAMYILGLPEQPVSGLRVSNMDISMHNEEQLCWQPVFTEPPVNTCMEGIYAKNIRDCSFDNVTVQNQNGEAIIIEQGENVRMDGRQVYGERYV